ncbi:hypothetical protein [Parasphingorhabdus sp.]|uniref:hypothetical protein n=1 Tax=Parasphingorhabdus sp. TaxID=2709688 RepID=UPI0032EF3C55
MMQSLSIEFWQAVSAVSSIILIVITGIYAYLTFRMVRNSEEQLWQSTRALVVAKVTVQQGALLILKFENLGPTNAESFTVDIDRPIIKTIGQKNDIRELPFFKNGLSTFPPNAPIAFSIGLTHEWLNENTDREMHPASFSIKLTYATGGRKISETIELNIVDQLYYSSVQRDYIEDFGRTFPDKFNTKMDKIAKQLDALSDKEPPPIFKRRSWSHWFWKERSWHHWHNRW